MFMSFQHNVVQSYNIKIGNKTVRMQGSSVV